MNAIELILFVPFVIVGTAVFFGLILLLCWVQERWADPCLDYWCCSEDCYE